MKLATLLFLTTLTVFGQQRPPSNRTVIKDNLFEIYGALFEGKVSATLIQSQYSFSISVQVYGGALSIPVYPGVYAVTSVSDKSGITLTDTWNVPVSNSPVNLNDVGARLVNIQPQIGRSFYVTAASCVGTSAASSFDSSATNAPVPACSTGTNVVKGVLVYSGGAGATTAGMFSQKVPSTALNSRVTAAISWYSSGTSGNVKLFVGVSCSAMDGTMTDDPAFTDNSVIVQVPGVANLLQTSTVTSIVGCPSGTLMHIRVKRDKNDVQDTAAADVNVVGVEGQFQ